MMARTPCYFIDLSIPDTYAFNINPDTENTREASRSYTETGRSDVTASPLLQQGTDPSQKIEISGTILHPNQDAAFAIWFQRSKSRTIIYQDWAGYQYVVLIERYSAPRQRVAYNATGGNTYMKYSTIQWSMTLRIVKTLTGPWSVMA